MLFQKLSIMRFLYLATIDGRRRYYYKVRSETKKSIEAGKTLGKKLKEQSGGDYKK